MSEIASVVLCAGAGTRLRPVTERLPKALCTVANTSLLRWALDAPLARGLRRAVNAHHHDAQVVEHVRDLDVHVSLEQPQALGTAGALAALRPWLDGAAALVHNADAWVPDPPAGLVSGWDGERPRLLVRRTSGRSDFGPHRFLGVSLLPAADVARLRPEPSGLYEVMWAQAWAEGRLELVEHDGVAFDVGTAARLLAANLAAGDGRSFVHPTAVVTPALERCVALPGAVVTGSAPVAWSVLGPGELAVACDPDEVLAELAVGRGGPG